MNVFKKQRERERREYKTNYLPFVGRSTLFLCYTPHLLAKTLKPRVLFVGGEFCFIFGEMNGRIRGKKGNKIILKSNL